MAGDPKDLGDLTRVGARLVIKCLRCRRERTVLASTVINAFFRQGFPTHWATAHKYLRCRNCGRKDRLELDVTFLTETVTERSITCRPIPGPGPHQGKPPELTDAEWLVSPLNGDVWRPLQHMERSVLRRARSTWGGPDIEVGAKGAARFLYEFMTGRHDPEGELTEVALRQTGNVLTGPSPGQPGYSHYAKVVEDHRREAARVTELLKAGDRAELVSDIEEGTMCNRKHQSDKAVQLWLDQHGVAIDADWTDRPRPGQLFPTGKKTPRYGLVVRRQREGNRPLVASMMEWGVPTQVPSKRDPKVKLTTYVTNARNLQSPFWRSALANPASRCLVPFTHFAEPHPEGGKGDDGQPRQAWFCLPDQPVGVFAGFWRMTERGPAYAFATCEPNDIVGPIHPKAMPAILKPDEWEQWLEGSAEEAAALVRPYDGPMDVQVATPLFDAGGALDVSADPNEQA